VASFEEMIDGVVDDRSAVIVVIVTPLAIGTPITAT